MTALLAVEFDLHARPEWAVNALRRPTMQVLSLEVGSHEVVALVETADAEALLSAEAMLRCCPGIRSSTAFLVA
jgi:hypothetical protein